jgi:hypothetical protein
MSVVKIVNEGGEYLYDVEKGTAVQVAYVPVSDEVAAKLKKHIEVVTKMDAASSLKPQSDPLEVRLGALEARLAEVERLIVSASV